MKNILKNIYLIIKRVFDFVFAAILLIILLIPFAIIAILIKTEDRGPVFYTQDRVGKKLKNFKIYKFRSMKTGRKELESNLTHDEMVTNVGKFIRKTSIDELPQLFNILKGDMSIVGNRPLPLYEAELLTSDAYIDRFMAPSGLTGLWQVEKRGGAGKMSAEERKQLDIKYARDFSAWLDLKIIFKTLTAFIQKENV